MLYAFYELSNRLNNVRLHIMGGVDDEEYAQECYDLVKQMQLDNVIFTGRVDIVTYMENLDFTILTSISEAQPLSVLESLASGRPCVTTDVGCCRELLEGGPGDDLSWLLCSSYLSERISRCDGTHVPVPRRTIKDGGHRPSTCRALLSI